MWSRLFGRSKDDAAETSCAECGRTLLAGEWTQRLVDDGGGERFICALCSRPVEPSDDDTGDLEPAPAGTGRVRMSRTDSDAFWRALKDKDAEIVRLQSLLARSEAEKQELVAQLAALRGADDEALSERAGREAIAGEDTMYAPPPEPFGDDTAAPVIVPDVVVPDVAPPVFAGAPPAPAAPPVGDDAYESTDPHLGETLRAAADAQTDRASDVAPQPSVAPPVVPPEAAAAAAPEPEPPLAQTEEELGVPLTILQRGVDLLNVSAVPKRIVETNQSLGVPTVHVGSQDASTLLVTFVWTMGWYQFRVELADSGRITLAERGYEERTDLRPNATVRADGTVQLAPTSFKPPTPKDDSDQKPPAVTSGVIISKSLMGQRTDDENVATPWDNSSAPDFDWGR